VKNGQVLSEEAFKCILSWFVKDPQVLNSIAAACYKFRHKYERNGDQKVLRKILLVIHLYTGHACFYQNGILYSSNVQAPLITDKPIENDEFFDQLLLDSKEIPWRKGPL
jgi:hypothetical protein